MNRSYVLRHSMVKTRCDCWIAVALLCIVHGAAAQQVIRVPHGTQNVMVDGKLSAGEWDDAARFSIGEVARGYIKQSRDYVWIAVERLTGDDFALDFYLQPSDRSLYDLHSSAKLGERKLQGSSWSDHWTWWNNDRWVANWSRVDSFDQRTFLPQRVREFQIARERFPGDTWHVMFELLLPAEPQWQTFAFPRGARNTSTELWMVLDFK